MKTTTYCKVNDRLVGIVSDKPELTPEQYAHACRTLNICAKTNRSKRQAIDILRESAIQTPLYSTSWMMLIHAAAYLKGRS